MTQKNRALFKKPAFWVVIAVIAAAAFAAAFLINYIENSQKSGTAASSGSGSAVQSTSAGSASSVKESSQPSSSESSSQSSAASSGTAAINYKNTQYGFTFDLPESWKGYTVVNGKWEGISTVTQKTSETGPLLYIRNPKWTENNPRQDIPVMVFTLRQWSMLQNEQFHIGAAPIEPKEYARNKKYVFALPARYNFDYKTCWEEVDKIVNSHPLHPNNDFSL